LTCVVHSIFLRIYSGLVFTLILALILSGLAFTIISGIRLQNYREASIQVPFRAMSNSLAHSNPNTWPAKLKDWEKQLGITLHVTSDEKLDLRKIWLFRLRQGKLTTRAINTHTFKAYILINRHTILSGTVSNIGQQFLLGSADITLQWLQSFPAKQRISHLHAIKNSVPYSYPIRLTFTNKEPLYPRQGKLLERGVSALSISERTNTILVYASPKHSNELLVLGPWKLFDLYPFRLLVALSLFVLIAVSIATYILVRGLERRVSQMKNMANDIAGGQLDARVHIGALDAIGKLGIAFNSMAKHLQRLLSIQQEMIHGVSHELRTPVARLRFALAMLSDVNDKKNLQQQIEEMDKDIEELDELIDEILTYAHLENAVPNIVFTMMNIESIIKQITVEQQRIHPELTITYVQEEDVHTSLYAEAEGRYIHRAVQNLVTNACRYAKHRIELRLVYKDNLCHIYVEDDGPGIPVTERERIFSAFARLDDSRTRSSGGYGLGLSIVQRIMAWHDGSANVSWSKSLKGACFHLSWPRTRNKTDLID